MKNIKTYAMVFVAIVAAIYAQLTDGGIDSQEWVVVAGTGVGSVGVYVIPNMSTGIAHYAKGIVAFLTAGLPALYVVILGGLTTAEVLEVLLAGAAAIGLTVGLKIPNYRFAIQRDSQAVVH